MITRNFPNIPCYSPPPYELTIQDHDAICLLNVMYKENFKLAGVLQILLKSLCKEIFYTPYNKRTTTWSEISASCVDYNWARKDFLSTIQVGTTYLNECLHSSRLQEFQT